MNKLMKENELLSIMYTLKDRGVTGIKIHYDGSGDSGAIEEINYTTEPCESPEDVDENVESWGGTSLSEISDGAYEKFKTTFGYRLLNNVEDWYNNEGGYGDICICVPSGKYIINNNVRIMNTEFYFHEGNLLEKSEE
jgi:hypothetical protein